MSASETIQELTEAAVDTLMREAELYLAAVEAFRSVGCGPLWADDEARTHWLSKRALEELRGLSLV